MLLFRDASSIRGAVRIVPDLTGPLTKRLSELGEFSDYEPDQLVNILVAQPGDRLEDLEAALGLDLRNSPVDSIETHPGWLELTYVVSDDGFGYVVYVPLSPDIDPRLLEVCKRRTEEGSA
jgi:hypothetical protein